MCIHTYQLVLLQLTPTGFLYRIWITQFPWSGYVVIFMTRTLFKFNHALYIYLLFWTERYVVAFTETTYTANEGDGQVEVCVRLTQPDEDASIGDVRIFVEIFNNTDPTIIPEDAKAASKLALPVWIYLICTLIVTNWSLYRPSLPPSYVKLQSLTIITWLFYTKSINIACERDEYRDQIVTMSVRISYTVWCRLFSTFQDTSAQHVQQPHTNVWSCFLFFFCNPILCLFLVLRIFPLIVR